MSLFFEDLAKGRISAAPMKKPTKSASNMATTPGAVIFENALIQMIQYSPTTDQVNARPLLWFRRAINKFYILDLQPENSFVRYAVEQGHTVFLCRGATSTPNSAT